MKYCCSLFCFVLFFWILWLPSSHIYSTVIVIILFIYVFMRRLWWFLTFPLLIFLFSKRLVESQDKRCASHSVNFPTLEHLVLYVRACRTVYCCSCRVVFGVSVRCFPPFEFIVNSFPRVLVLSLSPAPTIQGEGETEELWTPNVNDLECKQS